MPPMKPTSPSMTIERRWLRRWESSPGAKSRHPEPFDAPPGRFQHLESAAGNASGADAVQQHADRDALPLAFNQHVEHLIAECAVLPHEHQEVNRLASAGETAQQRGHEFISVIENLNRAAAFYRGVHEMRDGRNKLWRVDGRKRFACGNLGRRIVDPGVPNHSRSGSARHEASSATHGPSSCTLNTSRADSTVTSARFAVRTSHFARALAPAPSAPSAPSAPAPSAPSAPSAPPHLPHPPHLRTSAPSAPHFHT